MPQPYGETEPGTVSLPPAEIRQLAQLSPNQMPPPWSPLARKSNCFFMLLFSKSESSMKVSEWQSQRPLLRFSYQGGWENKCLSSALAKCVMWEHTHMKEGCSEAAGLATKTHLPVLPLPPVPASIFISSKKHSPGERNQPQSEPIFM